ncbi:hypothetical protein SPBR_04749 [Sporothrix brasiliensis 5110]|uniref:C2H2-type domain-containing protein n=1 Tax=Sporothrix brasiliensis 5110 TaxID=1398154 RepID=A0A0C2F8H9_9PEZI|nr:uncharacterized protein SPBR_04749 [Sporothrix brasiliensis 5110]KIH87363.1 hypothetical protein SPBR_04749 [Sporothrix brasiliensis 5110]
MALDAPAAAYGSLPPANLAAARQHVQTLSARDREALLRALLEQYEHPHGRSQRSSLVTSTAHSSRSSSSTAAGSISAFTSSSLFDCPPLHEEVEDDLAVPSLSSAKQKPQPDWTTVGSIATATATATGPHTSAKQKSKEKPVLRIKTSAADFRDTEPTITTKTAHSYWCTACGEKLGDRTAWILHDVACRGKERSLSCADDSRNASGRNRTQRAWACGFCAAFLGSLERYQSHVAGHFERGRTLGHWHYANVIYGLLHQPAVHKPWKQLWAARAAALPPHMRPKATWSPGCCLRGRDEAEEPIALQEALELFDPSHESASALALQADALAIYISVPIDEAAEKKQKKHARMHKSDPTPAKETKPQMESTKVQAALPAEADVGQQTEPAPAPAMPTTKLLPTSEPDATPSPPAPTNPTQTKDAPLPALPSDATPPQPTSLSPPDPSKKDVKRGSKLSPRKPLFMFRSKSPSSSPESIAEKVVPATKDVPARQIDRKPPLHAAKLSKPRRVVSTPATTAAPAPCPNAKSSTAAKATARNTTTATATQRTPISSSSTTTTPRPQNWADRPLPPLIMNELGVISHRATTTMTATPPIYTSMAAGYASDQPPKPPPKPRAYIPADTMGDWNSIVTTIVDDIMGPANALHITV